MIIISLYPACCLRCVTGCVTDGVPGGVSQPRVTCGVPQRVNALKLSVYVSECLSADARLGAGARVTDSATGGHGGGAE